MFKFFSCIIAGALTTGLYAQQVTHIYTLSGNINSDTGRVMLYPISSDSTYYPYKSHMETNVVNGKFMFTDSIDYPTAYRLVLQKNFTTVYVSGIFLVDTGWQTISCDVDSLRAMPKVLNSTMDEWRKSFGTKFKVLSGEGTKISQKKDSLRKVFKGKVPDSLLIPLAIKSDSLDHATNLILLHYAESNPNSYLVMWWLIFTINHYDPIYDTIYSRFSISVQKTTTGKKLEEKLRGASIVAVGKKFPRLNFLDSNYTPVVIPNLNRKNKYTLIDFWYSYCSACILQFPKLRQLLSQYKNSGFEIIGVSIDEMKYLNDWKNIIKNKELDWPQYWDKDAKCATYILSINTYPANFLLDENGVIVRRNIELNNLEKLLSELK